MRLVALKPFRYATRRLIPGDHFDTKSNSDARVLIGTKRARHINDRDRVDLAPPPAAVLARVAPKAAPKPAADDAGALKVARAEYEAKLGKRPFNGWDIAELRRRMAAG